jgi:hypothetical protein
VLWVGCGAWWLSETGGSTTLSVTDGSRRRGGDATSRCPLCSVANLRNINAPNPCPKRIRTAHSLEPDRKGGQHFQDLPNVLKLSHFPSWPGLSGAGRNRPLAGSSKPLMQTAPPSRIMLGGAALNPDSEIPRQLSVCGGAIRFNGRSNRGGLSCRSPGALHSGFERLSRATRRRRVQINKSAKIVKIPICAASQQIGHTPGGAKA